MKIDLNTINREQFYVNEHMSNGEICVLVQPQHIGCSWSQENKIFRSSVWNSNGELISADLPKFVNWGEKPEILPVPTSLKNTVIVEKLDGSTLIVSRYKGEFIIRTRGTIDASTMEQNGHEIELFKKTILPILKDKQFPSLQFDSWCFSFIFEWTSPLNQIVISYGNEPKFVLIGIINHKDYSMWKQSNLDWFAKVMNLSRPATYTFKDVDDLIVNVEKWQDKEGVCVYSKDGQEIHKVKAAKYLLLHHMKSELSSTEKIIDVWISQDYPSYTDFYNYISTTFDYELAEKCRGSISNICDAYKEVKKIIAHMTEFVEPLKKMPRKDAAMKILSAYGETNRKSFAFNILDSREIDSEGIKKLLFQVLK